MIRRDTLVQESPHSGTGITTSTVRGDLVYLKWGIYRTREFCWKKLKACPERLLASLPVHATPSPATLSRLRPVLALEMVLVLVCALLPHAQRLSAFRQVLALEEEDVLIYRDGVAHLI